MEFVQRALEIFIICVATNVYKVLPKQMVHTSTLETILVPVWETFAKQKNVTQRVSLFFSFNLTQMLI